MTEKETKRPVKNNEKMYYSLVRRKCKPAANYVKTTYLKNNVSDFAYCVKYPINSARYSALGTMRNFVRYVYRKIYVK